MNLNQSRAYEIKRTLEVYKNLSPDEAVKALSKRPKSTGKGANAWGKKATYTNYWYGLGVGPKS